MRWKDAIRRAIRDGDFFVACFSNAYTVRTRSYMNEELTLAVEEIRQRPMHVMWFIPVLLSDCQIPERSLGAGETLRSIQWVSLYEDWERGLRRIMEVILPGHPEAIYDALGTSIPPTGFAAVARRSGESTLCIVPVSVVFSPGAKYNAAVNSEDAASHDNTRFALEWVSAFIQRFEPRELLPQDRLGSDESARTRFARASFHFPPGSYESTGPIVAAMLITCLGTLLRGLMADLKLVSDFPTVLMIATAGFSPPSPAIHGEPASIAYLQHFSACRRVSLLHSGSQAAELNALLRSDSMDAKGQPHFQFHEIDCVEDIADEVLHQFFRDTKTDHVCRNISRLFTSNLAEMLDRERALQRAQIASYSLTQRLRRLDVEYDRRLKEAEYLRAIADQTLESVKAGHEVPSINKVLEEFTFFQASQGDYTELDFSECSDDNWSVWIPLAPEEAQDKEYCRRMYRRLVQFLRPVLVSPEVDETQVAWFIALQTHRRDKLFLQALEFAFEPFGSKILDGEGRGFPSDWVNRLFQFRATLNDLTKRINDLKQQALSFEDPTSETGNKRLEKREILVRIQEKTIDYYWRQLTWLLSRCTPDSANGEVN
jgi:hypothetical protein